MKTSHRLLAATSEGGESTNEASIADECVRAYFQAWNTRDMESAVALFSDDTVYEDTQYSKAFKGKTELRKHLNKVAKALPSTFEFVVDATSASLNDGSVNVGVQWHVENDGSPLPFTRGCSMYVVEGGEIISGFDVPEPAPFKQGNFGLGVLSVASKLIEEPIRALPIISVAIYTYVVFFSTGIIPGAPANELESRTWEEVLNLSLNFFLVAPILHLPFSPSVHPGLEGIFNLLLSWAAMFSGFAATEKAPDEPDKVGAYGKTLIGMQFLTSAFYLPYLGLRDSGGEGSGGGGSGDGGWERALGESKLATALLTGVGAASIYWGVGGGRLGEGYGEGLAERLVTLGELLSIDRVGCSFVVDLVIFGIFQGWMVDDDLRRRGVGGKEGRDATEVEKFGVNAAKFVPFFGLSAYLLLRPPLPPVGEK
ncbi:hypothetical protein TrCOL_g2576 [Triparma columacea]|uniref:SnoaL-like domain-containing protein n=1 Tax=Triparma columacea TaxID=722753 RepID=A0A9W7GMV7_9STRA|nr:hypothetical protein TrCOL_g2576 [Triparma columacea]